MISDTAVSEHTPLSRRQVTDLSGSSTSDNSSSIMDDTRRIVTKICIDFVILLFGE